MSSWSEMPFTHYCPLLLPHFVWWTMQEQITEYVKARLHGGISHGTSHGTSMHGISHRVNGSLVTSPAIQKHHPLLRLCDRGNFIHYSINYLTIRGKRIDIDSLIVKKKVLLGRNIHYYTYSIFKRGAKNRVFFSFDLARL
jgi:hypothetical protein